MKRPRFGWIEDLKQETVVYAACFVAGGYLGAAFYLLFEQGICK